MTSSVIFQNLTPSGNDCGICLTNLKNNENVIGHKFGPDDVSQHEYHSHCVRPWFEEGKDTCPICRARVSNVNQYLPSAWEICSRNIMQIVRRGVLGKVIASSIIASSVGVIFRTVLGLPESDMDMIITSAISCSTALMIINKVVYELPELSGLNRLFISMGIIGGNVLSNVAKIPGFVEIAYMSGILSMFAGAVSFFRRESSRDRIINMVLSGLAFGVSAMTSKIARTAISSLTGIIASYFAH